MGSSSRGGGGGGSGTAKLLKSFILLSLASALLIRGQTDFINIDCGKPKDYTYKDAITGLSYTSDFQYIDTGEIHQIASNFRTAGQLSQATDLRSFPNGIRNCYSVTPVTQGRKYLIRALHFYGNYDGKNEPPQFDMYIGVHFWYKSMVFNTSLSYYQEIMVLATSDTISICLVNTGSGTPILSGLELRPLPDELYPQVNSTRALNMYTRQDAGATERIRYPKDPYDRSWVDLSKPEWSSLATTSKVSTITIYEPPSDVMKTAAFPTTGSSLNVSWPWATNPRPWFHLFVHCSELQELQANETRIINIAVNGQTYFKNETLPYLKTISGAVTLDPKVINQNEIVLSVEQASGSTMPPILNAVELYNVIETDQSETDAGDVLAVTAIKRQHRLQKNWMGDPCLPKFLMWDGLSCSYDGFHSPRIISLNLSSSGLMGEIPTSLANLTQLQSLDLSRNSMQGGIPEYLATLTHLKLLDLSGNKLNGQIPKGLLDRSATGALTLKIGENSGSCSDSGVCGENEKKRSKMAIPVIVTAVSALILLVVAVVILRIRRQKIRQNPAAQNSQGKLWNRGRANHNNQYLQVPMENREFTYNDLVRITAYFKKEIGRGGFGPVYHGALDKHVEVAVKMLDKTGSSQGPKEFQTEARLLTRIHHKNLVSLVGYCKEIENLALVYEYMSKGSLEDHLRGKSGGMNTLKWKERLRIAVEAAQGLEYLHSGCNPSIVHRDVKPNNILLNNNMEAKIADFGISRAFENDICTHITTGVMGTPGYLDPEYYITQKLTEKSDVYSFGVVLLELVTGKPAIFMENGETHNVIHWVQPRLKKFEIGEIVDKRLQGEYNIHSVWKITELAVACTPPTSSGRPTMNEVLTHLKECVQLEIADTVDEIGSQTNTLISSSDSIEMESDASSLLE